jgi:DtxR family Mn-dependent transcriptional regulator
MADHGLLPVDGNAFELTARGRDSALHILRAHRLWERYLAEETGYVEAEWHDRAERHEHHISTGDGDSRSGLLGNPTHDPHGDPIPAKDGTIVNPEETILTELEAGRPTVISRVTQESSDVLRYLGDHGLFPDVIVSVEEQAPLAGTVTIKVEGRTIALGRDVARCIYVLAAVRDN